GGRYPSVDPEKYRGRSRPRSPDPSQGPPTGPRCRSDSLADARSRSPASRLRREVPVPCPFHQFVRSKPPHFGVVLVLESDEIAWTAGISQRVGLISRLQASLRQRGFEQAPDVSGSVDRSIGSIR